MAGTYILAHDLGTSGNKATLFDGSGQLVGSAFAAYATHCPHPNWAEQEPAQWWQAVCDTTRQLLTDSGIAATAIAAVGFSGMMMGCLPVAADGTPLRSCIIWARNHLPAAAGQRPGGGSLYR